MKLPAETKDSSAPKPAEHSPSNCLCIIYRKRHIPTTSRKEPDRVEANPPSKVPIDRPTDIAPACRISRPRVVDAGRIITAGGIASGTEHRC